MKGAGHSEAAAHGSVMVSRCYAVPPVSKAQAVMSSAEGIAGRRVQLNAMADFLAERGDADGAAEYRAQAEAL